MEELNRKKRSKNGECTSKMMSFRIDGDNVEFLNGVVNKGRLINWLLELERTKRILHKEGA